MKLFSGMHSIKLDMLSLAELTTGHKPIALADCIMDI